MSTLTVPSIICLTFLKLAVVAGHPSATTQSTWNMSAVSVATTAGASPSTSATPTTNSNDGFLMGTLMVWFLIALLALFSLHTAVSSGICYMRQMTCLDYSTQRYFRLPCFMIAGFKKHILYAPLLGKRHHGDFYLFGIWPMGTLPTRMQSIFLAATIGMNIALCIIGVEWSEPGSTAMMLQIRQRSGTLALINMIPLVIMAGRNNPLINLFDISYDTFNMMHRWLGRIFIVESVVHTVVWVIQTVDAAGWSTVFEACRTSMLIISGIVGTVVALVVLIQASAILRKACYELFLHIHILAFIIITAAMWLHLEGLQEQFYIEIVVAVWGLERLARLCSIIYRNVGNGGTSAVIEALEGNAVRVTIRLARPWTFRPGQHVYLTIPSIGLWTSHPFSVAWSSPEICLDYEKGIVLSRQDVLAMQRSCMSLVIRRQRGFTDKLYKRAASVPCKAITLPAIVEGPYAGHQELHSYGTVMLFAGGIGITHQIPTVRSLIIGYNNGVIATRRIILVWIIQNPDHLDWIRPWLPDILALDGQRDILQIRIYVTRLHVAETLNNPYDTVQMISGRPDIDALVKDESEIQIGAMAVSVCGTGGLADSIRLAVRQQQQVRNIDFKEESFSW